VKLLAHRIPLYLPCQELCKIFSGNPNIDDKVTLKVLFVHQICVFLCSYLITLIHYFPFQRIDSRIRGEFYSTCISFNDVDEVEKAFEELDGQKTKAYNCTYKDHRIIFTIEY
jgi:RNA exonuclease 1